MRPPEQAPPSRPPAAAHERDLDDAEFAELGQILAGIPEPLQPLMLDEADGYLAGIAVQSRAFEPEEWVRFVFDAGGHRWGESEPSPEQRRATDLLLRREAAIRVSLAEGLGFEPWIADPEAGEDPVESTIAPWAGGFVAALELFPPAVPAGDQEQVDTALAHLARYLEPDIVDKPATVEQAVIDLVHTVYDVYDCTERERYRVTPARREQPKVGRNDPCPCGSGRKFKQCHGKA